MSRKKKLNLNMFVFVDSVVSILFLSLSCLESYCFSATFREILLPSSGKVCECVSGIMCLQRIEIF